ncbi:MAG: GNAT family N-acetyltransferase [Alphaproteobacteria bacterium]|nr:GNAT family N-acetyltransferase [Alphaproteobacteria bacterium]MBN2675546.1 GNAT family N-acetyltransferase [Alphaproteobacteria bacterium]
MKFTKITFKNDPDLAIKIMLDNSKWQLEHNIEPTWDWLSKNLNMARFKSVYKVENHEFLVLFVDDKPTGAVIFQKGDKVNLWPDGKDKKAMYIYKFCVANEFHGQGISEIFLDNLKKRAIKKGFNTLRLDTADRKHALRKIYEKAGFLRKGIKYGMLENWGLYEWVNDTLKSK